MVPVNLLHKLSCKVNGGKDSMAMLVIFKLHSASFNHNKLLAIIHILIFSLTIETTMLYILISGEQRWTLSTGSLGFDWRIVALKPCLVSATFFLWLC